MFGSPSSLAAASRHERIRRYAATAIAVAGGLNLFTAVTPPLRGHLALALHLVPLAVSQTAAALTALAGLALLGLARGVRRGQHQAWAISVAVLGATAVLHLMKGVELGGAGVGLAVLAFLVLNRRSFRTAVDGRSRRLGATALVVGALISAGLATIAVELSLLLDPDEMPVPLGRALLAVSERLVGIQIIALPTRLNEFLTPSLLGVGLALAACAVVLCTRPVVDRRRRAGAPSRARARAIVERHGHGTLDYFALRHDKQHFFDGDTLIAYAVYGGVCLVSPDPIGPRHERGRAWERFVRFADAKGWIVAVLGAGADWLPAYRLSGMHDLYVGDEAVVDVRTFRLDGKKHKGLRQAVNRIARYGYTVSFHDPTELEPGLAEALAEVMTKSRRGGRERGFSMTLGRVFDPEDRSLLLAVARDAGGTPVAFCQYVPAPGIDGYSLDLMRRDPGDHPNGLIDFLIVSTIEHLRQQNMSGLGLNFATMRAVLAGESGRSLSCRLQRWALQRMSGMMQIESLWRFNAKYEPSWNARYVVYGSPEHLPSVAMAIARAESFWELPVIGRFFVTGRVSEDVGEERSLAAV